MAKSSRSTTRTTSRGRGGRSQGAVEVFKRPGDGMVKGALALLVRLRTEIFVIVVLAVGWYEIHTHLPTVAAYVLLNGVPVALFVWPVSRRFIVRRFWCVISRHRLRACMVQIRSMMNYSGWLPWIIWARPTPVGERVVLWLRPGICIEDLEDRTEHIAVSCWARDARVRRSRRLAALVIVDVMRRDPLTGRKSAIDSPLATVGADGPKPPPVSITAAAQRHLRPVRDTANSTSDGAVVAPALDEAKPKRQRKDTTKAADSAAVVVNGEDISDYL